jgi:16S rRNA (uracil1498-N3)-methyltransferase
VSSLLKRELVLTKLSHQEVSPLHYMDLALGIPKKEALELSLKQAVELGFTKIFLIRAQYSQTKLPEDERLESLLISALEQSNAAFLPLVEAMNWEDLPLSNYNEIMMLDSQYSEKLAKREKVLGPKLLIVGPEGGFSPEECLRLHQFPKLSILNLPTPILRTPTAVATGAGILLGSLLD